MLHEVDAGRVVTPRELEPSLRRSRPHVTWTDGAGSHAVELGEPRTAGSAALCDFVIVDKAVSRIHCELDPEPDGLWVRDLGSRNGTYINGVKVIEARVPAGAVLRLGTTDMTVTYASDDPADQSVTESTTMTSFGALEGYSASMRDVFTTLAGLAKADTSILVEGEPGTGKKALARAIHDASSRAEMPFVIVDCAGLPTSQAESVRALEEMLESAQGGTLVLDAPAELPLPAQRELVEALGAGTRTLRVIVTTQRDLRRLVNAGAFREDLYVRLAGSRVRVPPLRHRKADVLPLLERFLGERASLLSSQLLADLEHLPWLGNVRELRLYAESLRSDDRGGSKADERIRRDDGELETMETPIVVPSLLAAEPPLAEFGRVLPLALEPWFLIGFKEFRERWIELGEREYLRRLMHRTGRSSSAASREAGLERTYLYRLVKKHGV